MDAERFAGAQAGRGDQREQQPVALTRARDDVEDLLDLPGGEPAWCRRCDTDALDARDRVGRDVLVAVAPAQEAGERGVRAGAAGGAQRRAGREEGA
jgi:hypothetical protein